MGHPHGIVGAQTPASGQALSCSSTPRPGLRCSAPIRPDVAGRFALDVPAGRISIASGATARSHGSEAAAIEIGLAPGELAEARIP